MQDSIAPLMPVGAWARSLPIIFHMMVAVQATGSMRMSIGPLVSSPPTSLWWSMIVRMSALLMAAGSSAGLLVSTMTTGWSASTSEMISGLSSFQWSSMNAASVLGSPSKTGLASSPLIWLRYHAQMIGLPVLSVSGDLCPNTRVVMGRLCSAKRHVARLIGRAIRDVTSVSFAIAAGGGGSPRRRGLAAHRCAAACSVRDLFAQDRGGERDQQVDAREDQEGQQRVFEGPRIAGILSCQRIDRGGKVPRLAVGIAAGLIKPFQGGGQHHVARRQIGLGQLDLHGGFGQGPCTFAFGGHFRVDLGLERREAANVGLDALDAGKVGARVVHQGLKLQVLLLKLGLDCLDPRLE